MRTRFGNDRAYFLHQVPYRDNSAIVHLFTRENGKVAFLLSGLKAKKNAKRPFLIPCKCLVIDYTVKPGLSQLLSIDFYNVDEPTETPSIDQFMLYQYANELLLTVLPDQLPTPTLFDDYGRFLQCLVTKQPNTALRHIELALITLFMGLPTLSHTEDTKAATIQGQSYWFDAERGLFANRQGTGGITLEGGNVLAFHYVANAYVKQNTDKVSEALAQGAKPLASYLIQHLLNGKTLKTRAVFKALNQLNTD